MIAALEAAEDAGGDIRGKQSASILVVKAHAADKTGKHRVFDLRVEDHPEPIKELKRLLKVFEAYEYMKIGNLATEKNDIEGALKAYSRARTMLPDNLEVKYWHAVSLANLGMIKDALPIFEEVFAKSSSWLVLTRRVHAVGRLNVSEEDLDRILSLMASPSPR
jgi:tetratricopeptide (TPR) repeat protein